MTEDGTENPHVGGGQRDGFSPVHTGNLQTDGDTGKNLVFMVSLPRSGSTLLQRILSNHPDIHTVAEPWFMLHPLYALKREGFNAEYDAGQARQALDEFLGEVPGGEESYIDAVRAMASTLYSRVLQPSGKRLFLDKTPRYFYILPELKRVFPKAKFILLLRNPAAVLSSVLKTWFGNDPQLLQQSSNYADMIKGPELLSEGVRILGDAAVTVHYEDLIDNPDDTVAQICAHLGVPYRATMLEYSQTPAPKGNFGDPSSVHRHDTVVSNYVSTWRDHLAGTSLLNFACRYIDSLGDAVIGRMGYSHGKIQSLIRGEQALDPDPRLRVKKDPENLNKDGERAFHEGDIEAAEALFNQAYETAPENIDVLNNLVVLHWQKGDLAAVLDFLLKALALDPYDRNIVLNGGEILAALGRPEEAYALYTSYLEKLPGDEEISRLLPSSSPQGDTVTGDTTDSSQPLVTAIVSTYNSELYLRGCLQDLEGQSISDQLEIIVVDSGSQQNEGDIVREFQQHYKNIHYIRTEQRETIYAAWNRAIQEAQGKYLTNANTDDRHRHDAYERMVQELEKGDGIALVYADSSVTEQANSSFSDAPVVACFKWPDFESRNLFSDCYIGPQPMWRRSLHEKYGLFDSRMQVAGDYDFWLRIAVSETLRHIPEVLGLYLNSSDSLEHAFSESAAMESELARRRNWPVEWGERPEPGSSYLVPVAEKDSHEEDQCKPMPLVSIIMPTKNRLELLGRALDSIITQTYGHWELIVVNDGGDDVTHVVDSRSSCGSIRCIKLEQSGGQAAARNIALQEAKGEIICYLDDDDIYLTHHLETVVTALSLEGRPFVYTDAVLVPERYNNGLPREESERSNPYKHDEYSRARLLVNNYIPINTWAHWKACVDQVGMFDESLNCYEDWEFLLRLSARYEFTHIGRTTVEVRFRVDRVDNITRQRLADTANAYRIIYGRHADDLPEELLHERSMKLQALEYDAADRRQSEQTLSDITVGNDGECTEDRDSTGRASGEQRAQYLGEQFLHRVEESGYMLPSIHLIMVVEENDMAKIANTIDSLDQQIYAGWGLSIISTTPPPHQDFDALPMLEWIQSEDVGQSFFETARQSECDWVASVMPGDTLEPEALSVFVDYINQNFGWKFVYSDEDCVDASGKQVNHKFKPDINPDYLCSCPYIGNLSLVRRDMLEQLSSDINIPTASFYDLALKVLRNHGDSAIGHIPTLLYHQLQDNECRETRDTWVKPVLEAYVRRNKIDARVLPGAVSGTCMIDYRCSDAPEICIAIYVGSDFARVERTVASLLNKTAYSNWTIRLGVDTALAPLFDKYQSEQLSVDPLDKKASRCSYFDSLAQTADADYMVFMDSGVIVLQDNWLDRLLAQGQRSDVGVVGIRLLSPHNKVVHAGILTGIGSFGVGGCIGEGDSLEQEGYMQRSQIVQNLSAVSSACMLVKRSLYCSLQGFDAGIAVQLYRDIDFCLRVRKAGARIVWTPFVTMLISDERLDTYEGDDGISRVEQDARQVTSKWLASLARDPAYNRNLTLKQEDISRGTAFRPGWDPNIRDLPRITACGAGSFVAWAYRVAQPLDALSVAGRASYSCVPFKGDKKEHMPSIVEMERIQADVLLLYNTLHDHSLDSVRQYRNMSNMFMVFGQDDLLFAVPPKSSCFKRVYKDIKKRLRTCLSMMDRLVVTGEPLADELSGFISDIRVVPNYLDARLWGSLESRRGCGVKPRVGWAGAMQHHGDLQVLADAVRETADEVDWIFMGMCPDFLRPYVKEVHEYVTFNAYPEMLAKLNLDLAVAPLERNRFNRCKSNLRILEYGAMGWPVIASDIEPYREAPVHLVSNQTRAWVNAIREHIHDLDTNWKAGDTLQEWVRENCLLQQHLDDWLDALDPAGGSHCQALAPGKASGL